VLALGLPLTAHAVPDPAASTAASSTYTYANSNPMVYSDPTGPFSFGDAMHFLNDNFNPIPAAPDAWDAAKYAWQVCHGDGTGSCALAGPEHQ
jgi:hypothetical protein